MNDFPVSPELLAIYLEDARAQLDALDHALLSLEREGLDPAVAAGLLGPLHTLKGNSGMMGFAGIRDYVHRLEEVFVRIRDRRLPFSPALFDLLFSGASALRDAVEQAGRDRAEGRDLGPAKDELASVLGGPPLAASPAAAPPAAPAGAPDSGGLAEARYAPVSSPTVRVDFAQLDHLLNLAGELIIHRTKLQRLGQELAGALGGAAAARQLLDTVHQVTGLSRQLQQIVMDVRMLPIRHVFERFPRLVRDLARQQGKEVEIILEGENTRIDKAIIDEIGEPLVHLIRNAVDHGIEPASERVARGKTPAGTILLSASQESSHVLITVMDDGAGIDAAAVRGKAVARGLLREEEAVAERDLVQLIFAPGFSTSEEVSEVSGRGVGLDVVLKSIERLDGLVEVETVPGVGTKFIIQLPLTLAIISALLVEVSGLAYAVPLGSVVRSLKLHPEQVHRINGRETLRLGERIVPLVRLGRFFGLPVSQPPRQYAVILGRGEKRLGLVVDSLKGQQDVVIKALDPCVSGPELAVASATIMGDGRVVLILDVAALFDLRRQALLAGPEPAPLLSEG